LCKQTQTKQLPFFFTQTEKAQFETAVRILLLFCNAKSAERKMRVFLLIAGGCLLYYLEV